jgi:microcystin-dependent protein
LELILKKWRNNMAKIKFIRKATDSELENVDVVDGQFLVSGQGTTYVDFGQDRVSIGTTPDTAMSDSSINSVQNKVVKEYVDSKILIGEIKLYGGSILPTGFLRCDGSAVSRTTYADLFSVIGVTYGAGDGSTTFNLPNLKGKVPVGLDSNDTDFDNLGETGGEKTHTLTVNEMPAHTNNNSPTARSSSINTGSVSSVSVNDSTGVSAPYQTGSKGGGQAHNNLQPYLVVNYIIKY